MAQQSPSAEQGSEVPARQIRRLRSTWDRLGRDNPMWAVLTSSESWAEDEFFASGEAEVEQILDHLGRLGIVPAGSSALDLGCGLGRISRALAARFERVLGVDIAASMIEGAKEANPELINTRFVLNEEPNLGWLADDQFDLVYSSITLQHMPEALARVHIREFVRVCAPDGVIVFQIPDSLVESIDDRLGAKLARTRFQDLIPAALRKVRRRLNPPMEMNPIALAEVETILREAGADVVEVIEDGRAGPQWLSYRYVARPS